MQHNNPPELKDGLTRSDIMQLLADVGNIMHTQGLHVSIYIVGGAAISLTYDTTRRTTQDVDASILNHPKEFSEAVTSVANIYNLPENWLNTSAVGFMSQRPMGEELEIQFPGITVISGSPEHLIAMKIRALRKQDIDDLVFLIQQLDIHSPEDVAKITNEQFDESDMFWHGEEEALYAAQDVFEYAASLGIDLTKPKNQQKPFEYNPPTQNQETLTKPKNNSQSILSEFLKTQQLLHKFEDFLSSDPTAHHPTDTEPDTKNTEHQP